MKASIRRSPKRVFLRADLSLGGQPRQVSRVLRELEAEHVLNRAGQGVYLRAAESAPVEELLAEVKTRLGKRVNRLVTLGNITIQVGVTAASNRNAQAELDVFKLRLAQKVIEKIDIKTIRRCGLENLARWKQNDVWCSAYDEWRSLLEAGSDEEIIVAMTGEDEDSNRLRQSPPYVGLLDRRLVEQLREAI
ncbi:hypothetical protein [Lacisediminimonas sp.]|uniref:hypothetical protein n=1 Tax=Lacisediminimonas sp. TaxID=3060582 RepID=UPI00272C6134|nr:hypothetical protein [Lacisediminimonas sp.]